MYKKQVNISPDLYNQVDHFSEMILNDLNQFFPKGVFVGLDENQDPANIHIQKKTEVDHIYLCAYEEVQSFFAILIFKNEETKDCWIEFSYASQVRLLKSWVKEKLEEHSEKKLKLLRSIKMI